MQEGPVRAVALPPSPTAAALARLRTRAFAPIPLALPRPFASVWLRLRAGRSRGAARRVAPRSRIPARRVAPPLPHLRLPRATASNMPHPNTPSCSRARGFWPRVRRFRTPHVSLSMFARSRFLASNPSSGTDRPRSDGASALPILPTWAFAGEERPLRAKGRVRRARTRFRGQKTHVFPHGGRAASGAAGEEDGCAAREGGWRRRGRPRRARGRRGRAARPRRRRERWGGGKTRKARDRDIRPLPRLPHFEQRAARELCANFGYTFWPISPKSTRWP